MLRVLFLLAACARVGALNCRSDSCGDISNDCCAPPGEARSCTRPGFTVQSGGVTSWPYCEQDDIYQCCTMEEDCVPDPGKCDDSIGGDCCMSKYTQFEERRCRDGWVPIYTGIGCFGEGNEFTCYPPSCSALPADNCGPNSCSDGNCNPNQFKCDSSIGGDCCTARDTSYEDRRCRDGWIPIYTGVGCGLPPHENEGNMFTCYPPTCSALPEDNCGPNSCYDGGEIAKVVLIVVAVIAPLAIIGTLGGVYGCYKGKCCCFSQQPKPPQPVALSAVAQPVIPMVQPATMAYQAQPVAQQAQPLA